MKKLLAFFILHSCLHSSFGQSITINIVSPRLNPIQLVDSNLNIQAIIQSTNTLSEVTAIVSGRQTSLVYNSVTGHYGGNLSLAGLPQDTLNLQVAAKDILDNMQTADERFIYHLRPLLIIDSPISWSVARPMIRIRARCIGTGGCTLKLSPDMFNGLNFTSISFGDSVDSVLDLSASEGMRGDLNFTATDKSGTTTQASRVIFVENSSYLKQVFAANDLIYDFNYHKILVSNPLSDANTPPDLNPYAYRSRIINILTGDSVPIPYPGPVDPDLRLSQITPYGAIFNAVDTITHLNAILDWNAGSLDTLSLNAGLSLKVAGNYATWLNGALLYLRDLSTATNVSIGAAEQDDVAPNGAVAFMGNDYNIYRFANNVSVKLTDNTGNKWNTNPSTDGYNIAYTKEDPCCIPCCNAPAFSLHLYKGSADTTLSDIGELASTRIISYQLNNKFVAYPKQDSVGNLQIWRKDSSGADARVTSFNNDSKAELLNPAGDLTLVRKSSAPVSRRYFASRSTGQITEISSSLGQIFYLDSTWYLAIGRMLYKIDLSSLPGKLSRPVISGLDSAYCSDQGTKKVKILNLPDTSAGNSATTKLDGNNLPIAPDTSFSFNTNTLAAGIHRINITYSNVLGTLSLLDSFLIVSTVTPDVNVSSNISTVVNLTDPVIITATNAAGGGTAPRYTFARDRNFTSILQAEGASNTLSISPSTLTVGANWIFVRMKTSAACYTSLTNLDSVQVVRSTITGILDPDFPDQHIDIFPNPFGQSISITGLSSSKTYIITLHNALGKKVYQQQVSNSNTVTLSEGALPAGSYWLSIYDLRKNRSIGVMPVIKK